MNPLSQRRKTEKSKERKYKNMKEDKTKEKFTSEEKSKAAEIARLIAQLPEKDQEKAYYMLKGWEFFNSKVLPMHRAEAL